MSHSSVNCGLRHLDRLREGLPYRRCDFCDGPPPSEATRWDWQLLEVEDPYYSAYSVVECRLRWDTQSANQAVATGVLLNGDEWSCPNRMKLYDAAWATIVPNWVLMPAWRAAKIGFGAL